MEKLNGPLSEIILNFINYKKSLGYKYDNINNLICLNKLFIKENINSLDDKDKIDIFINKLKNNNNKFKNLVKELTNFYCMINYKKNIYSKSYTTNINNSKRIPYIISYKEFESICKILDYNILHKNKKLMYSYSILYRLLYSTGLRISEALSLEIPDFIEDSKSLLIRNSKNNVTRLIPISESMFKELTIYLNKTKPKKYIIEYNNKPLTYSRVKSDLNLINDILKTKIRIHDFRHTFATTTILNLLNKENNEEQILYYLHIYLGHKSIEETEYYFYFTNVIKEGKMR